MATTTISKIVVQGSSPCGDATRKNMFIATWEASEQVPDLYSTRGDTYSQTVNKFSIIQTLVELEDFVITYGTKHTKLKYYKLGEELFPRLVMSVEINE